LACDARNLIPPSTWPTSLSPSRAPMEPNPTKIPTDMPIGPPDPLPFPSKDVKGKIFAHATCKRVYLFVLLYIYSFLYVSHIRSYVLWNRY
jgi:hypothetical protein